MAPGTKPRLAARRGRLGASLVGGVLVAGALPPLGWWEGAPLGCALLYLALRGAPLRLRLCSGVLFGIGQLSLGLLFVLQFSALGYVVLVLAEALFLALAAVLAPARLTGPALCGALTLSEWARERLPFGGLPPGGIPLGTLSAPFAPLARLGGPALLTLAVGATGVAAARVVSQALPWGGRRPAGRPVLEGLAVLASVALLIAAAVLAPSGGTAQHTVRAVAVQGGGVRGLSQIAAPSVGAFDRTLAEAGELSRGVELELWPEDTVPLPEGATSPASSLLGQSLGALARHLRATVIAGVTEPIGTTQFLNEVVAWDASGQVVGSIEKVHAVPFGEYVPLRGLLSHFIDLSAVPRDAIFGHNDGLLRTDVAPIGVLISFETFFPSLGRSAVRAGAEMLVAPTNTASYSSAQVPAQELAATRLQAIACGRDVLQAATTGYSALVAPSGEILAQTALGRGALLFAAVPLRSGMTLYDRFGELPVLVLAVLLILISWVLVRRSRPPTRPAR